MYSLIFLTIGSFAISLLLTPLVRSVFRRLGVMDQPNERKIHVAPVPRAGGVAIFLAYVGAVAVFMFMPLSATSLLNPTLLVKLLPAAGLVFLIGLCDDVFGLKPWLKLAFQIIASIMAYAVGVHFGGIGGQWTQNWWNLPLTLIWLVGCTNAFNLIDGVDGLATGVGLFATLTMFLAALTQNHTALALATAPLAGALLGFLRYNFNPASIFLGDCGSLFIGFVLGCYGLIWSQKSVTLLGITAPFMALAVPVLDTCLAVVRRFLRHQPIFTADRDHIHHRLLSRGLSPRRVTLILYAICGVAAGLSLLQSMLHNSFGGLVIVIFCAVTWMGIQHLGYTEFTTARQLISQSTFRRILDAQMRLWRFEAELKRARNVDECWKIICELVGESGFSSVRMQFAGRVYEKDTSNGTALNWTVRIPLTGEHYINLRHGGESSITPMVVLAPLAEILQRVLASHLPAGSPEVAAVDVVAAGRE